MPSKATPILTIVILALLTVAAPVCAAATEQVLYSFCSLDNCTDGDGPAGGLIFDNSGNLYGVTQSGGANGYGGVFELTPNVGGGWTETVLYSFCTASGCADGRTPQGNLVFDRAGSLYGVTQEGGASGNQCGGSGCGAVFELTPNGGGTWTETVLHSFDDDGKDGWEPVAGLIFDATGNLYGTTLFGGSGRGSACSACGTVFRMTRGTNGWTETIIHNFCSAHACADGAEPQAGLTLDSSGKLYGTTTSGGAHNTPCGATGCGVVFQLTLGSNGNWKARTLYNFTSRGGSQAGLVFDAKGNPYGTTSSTAFKLNRNGNWTEKVLHMFGKDDDGAEVGASLTFGKSRNLYGTTFAGGSHKSCFNNTGCGTVFRLSLQGNGDWTESILHGFDNNNVDGTSPHANVILDAAGNLYGTTAGGGANSRGTVFEITP